MIESGVPVSAFDSDRVEGPLAIRPTGTGEALEGRPGELPVGTLVIADGQRPISLLFGAVASGRGVSPATRRTILLVVGVSGVPEIAVEEAIWIASEVVLGTD
jgi:phenylalanyl-tRNA synthetase beta subunit